jgi:hypothetical protein
MTPRATGYPQRQPTDLQERLRDQEVRELRQETLQEIRATIRKV